jgi:hypothetical protein
MSLRGLRAPVAAGAVALAVVLVPSSAAWANGGDAIGLDIRNTSIQSVSSDGLNCTWDIVSDLTVVNLTQTPLDISAVAASATWQNGSVNGVVPVTIVDDAGLQPGDTIDPAATVSYQSLSTTLTIPCAATDADLAVRITDQFGSGSGDAPFISSSTPLPVTAIGGLTLAGLLSVALTYVQRRHRRTSRQPA